MVEIWWQNCQGNESRGTIDLKRRYRPLVPEDEPGRYVETGNRSIRKVSVAADMKRVKVPIPGTATLNPASLRITHSRFRLAGQQEVTTFRE
jgi:hypothetical protein